MSQGLESTEDLKKKKQLNFADTKSHILGTGTYIS